MAARYEDDYVKVNGEWKYQHLCADLRMSAPYEKGWAERAEQRKFASGCDRVGRVIMVHPPGIVARWPNHMVAGVSRSFLCGTYRGRAGRTRQYPLSVSAFFNV